MLISPNASLLVTGGCGFMGSAFIRYLLEESDFTGRIINLDKLSYAATKKSLQAIENSRRYHFYEGDICDEKLISYVMEKYEVDAVVHFAAETHVDRSIDHPATFFDTNIRGTFLMLEMIRKYPNIHFHHVSTDEVFGSLGESGQFYEHSPFRPNSPYSASKASADHLIRAYSTTYNLSTTISHSCNNYGPFQYPEKFIPVVILRALHMKEIPVYGQGRNIRSWIYVKDHARAIYNILQKGKRGSSYNIGGEEKSNLEILQMVLSVISKEKNSSLSRYEALIRFVSDRPGHDFRYALNDDKLRKETGFIPKVSLQEGLAQTVRWYEKHKDRLEAYYQNTVFSSM